MSDRRIRCLACGFVADNKAWPTYRCPRCGAISDALYCRERHPPALLSRSQIEAEERAMGLRVEHWLAKDREA